MKNILFFAILIFSTICNASIEVAFLQTRNSDRSLVQLEPNGNFSHIAISYKGKWLHAHPYRGVELVSKNELEKMGEIKLTIKISNSSSIHPAVVKSFLGKPYDPSFSWSDDKIYCSELIAKILNIDPAPMNFDSAFWPQKYKALQGELGISPDDIFNHFKAQGYKITYSPIQCMGVF